MRIRIWLSIAVLVALACAGLAAQDAAKTAKPGEPKKKDAEIVDGRADISRAILDKKTYVMKGNVRFTHGDTVMTSDEVTYDDNPKVKTAVSPGRVNITDPECDIAGAKGTAYFLKKVGVIEGDVIANFKPKASNNDGADKESYKTKLNQPTTITCQKIEYYYGKKLVNASGNVIFKQKDRIASADKASYDQNTEILVLTGHVKATDENGQSFETPDKVTISLKKGNEWMEAPNAQARFKIDTEEEGGEPKPEARPAEAKPGEPGQTSPKSQPAKP